MLYMMMLGSNRPRADKLIRPCGQEFDDVTDGACFGEENSRLAREQNVKLITTAISGTEVPEIYVSFPKEQCINCPHKEQCRVKVHKRVCSFTISTKMLNV